MVSEGRGRLFRRKDNKYLIYVPLKLAEDSMFPFKLEPEDEETSGVKVKVSFKIGDDKVLVEKWEQEEQKEEP